MRQLTRASTCASRLAQVDAPVDAASSSRLWHATLRVSTDFLRITTCSIKRKTPGFSILQRRQSLSPGECRSRSPFSSLLLVRTRTDARLNLLYTQAHLKIGVKNQTCWKKTELFIELDCCEYYTKGVVIVLSSSLGNNMYAASCKPASFCVTTAWLHNCSRAKPSAVMPFRAVGEQKTELLIIFI